MQELNMSFNMRTVISKLPFKLREQWRTTAHEVMERTNNRACFTDLVVFIERHVKILSDPIFGDIQDSPSGITHALSRSTSQIRNRVKGNVFAPTVTTEDQREEDGELLHAGSNETACPFCACRHSFNECKQFEDKRHKDKIGWLKQRGVCFACLCSGHISRDCEQRLICKVCGQTHPTVLHIK